MGLDRHIVAKTLAADMYFMSSPEQSAETLWGMVCKGHSSEFISDILSVFSEMDLPYSLKCTLEFIKLSK